MVEGDERDAGCWRALFLFAGSDARLVSREEATVGG